MPHGMDVMMLKNPTMKKDVEFRFASPEESPGYLLGQLGMLQQRQQKRILDPIDLTTTQFVLLAALGWLSKHSENVTQIDIANQSNADRMMVSKVLRTLEEKMFVTRHEHPADTRAKTVRLTLAGQAVLQRAMVEVEQADEAFFAALGSELAQFTGMMSKLIGLHSGQTAGEPRPDHHR